MSAGTVITNPEDSGLAEYSQSNAVHCTLVLRLHYSATSCIIQLNELQT